MGSSINTGDYRRSVLGELGQEIQRAQAGGHHAECILKHTPSFTEDCANLSPKGKAIAIASWTEVAKHCVGYHDSRNHTVWGTTTAAVTLPPSSCSFHHLHNKLTLVISIHQY